MRDLHIPPGILGGIHTSHPGSYVGFIHPTRDPRQDMYIPPKILGGIHTSHPGSIIYKLFLGSQMDSYMYIAPGIFYIPPSILENRMAL